MKNFFILLLCVLIIVSCKKKSENIIISGYIYSPLENKYLENVKVELKGQLYENNTWNSNYNTITSVTTDATGNFYIEHEKVRTSSLKIVATKNKYIDTEKNIPVDNIIPGEEYKMNLKIYPLSYLLINIKNELPANDNDEITITLNLETETCNSCLQSNNFYYVGSQIDTMIFGKVYGEKTYTIEWTTNTNGDITQNSQNIYCAKSDTGKITITF